MHHRFVADGNTHELWLTRNGTAYRLDLPNGESHAVSITEELPGYGRLTVNGKSEPIAFVVDGETVHIHRAGRAHSLKFIDPMVAFANAGDAAGHNVARAPMPGVVVAVKVEDGQAVVAGTVLVIIESMKLETAIRASQDGVIERIHVKAGDSFDRDAVLVTLSQENA